MREVEVCSGFDGKDSWEEEVLERNQEAPERAQQVVHVVEGRRGTNGERRAVVDDGDKTEVLYERMPIPSE